MKPFLHLSIVASLIAVLFINTGVAHASGTTITVNTTDGGSTSGDGFCSLQEAAAAANTDTAQDGGA